MSIFNSCATLRDLARPFDFSATGIQHLGEARDDADVSPQPPLSKEVASPADQSQPASVTAEPTSATLRDVAQPFRFPAELIDREPSPGEVVQELLRGSSRASLPTPEVADPDPEELEAAWSQEFSAQARLSERQKNAIALILAGEKEVRIAKRVGVHRGTLWRWRRQDPHFRRALSIARQRAFALAAEQLRELVPRAVEVVQSRLDCDNYGAAVRILRMARLEQHDVAPAEDVAGGP